MKKRLVTLVSALALGLSAVFTAVLPASAANRPFPKYELTYQWVHGTPDPNYDPDNPVGDGCLRDPNAEVTHLTTFAFGAVIEPCDAVRTTIRFYNDLQPGEEATIDFRWGVSWQYTDISDPNASNYIWKPVENFLFDGQPYPAYDVNDQDAMVVKDANGNFVRMSNGKGYYEPVHFIFDDLFEDGEEHTFQFDAYLPINGDWAGMSWGTGSTGDTQGGSIGAVANGLDVRFNAGADFRHVEDSVYREFLSITDPDNPLPNRTLGTWGSEVAGTTFSIEQCLEDRQLAPLTDSITANEIYPDLTYTTPIKFHTGSGSYLMARWPYEFMTSYLGSDFDSISGLRPFFRNGTTFDSYETVRPGVANFSYKPTIDSIIADIPGYTYVDNDLPYYSKGAFDLNSPAGKYNYISAKNIVVTYNKSGERIQHFYYTYEPLKTTFELTKTDSAGELLEGATFELFRQADMREYLAYEDGGYLCKRTETPELEEIEVCDQGQCSLVGVNRVDVPGAAADGTFSTDGTGTFIPTNNDGTPASNWLTPGTYYLREVTAPSGYVLDENPLVFQVEPEVIDDVIQTVELTAVNEEEPPPVDSPPTPPNTPPSDLPATPEPTSPSEPMPKTGTDAAQLVAIALAFIAGGAWLVRRKSA
ncbi:MAG: LPXTG cell wall anchor domain-containing protein [Actinomycetaceae bacterium]|nr:LPXTG cell wall anchor domain-containing protein [Actinomycetaceae bacterium]